MNAIEPLGPATNALFELQLRVARRADELAQADGSKTLLNLHCWLVAEAEILNKRLVSSPIVTVPHVEPAA